MTAVIQRVLRCSLVADGEPYSEIGRGLLILLGVREGDTDKDVEVLSSKIDGLRIFTDENDKMNLSVNDIGGSIMVEEANRLYEAFVERLRGSTPVRTGVFGADMQIELVNDGPITLVVNSEDLIKK